MVTFEKQPFKQCVQQDENLAALRAEYARRPADERRMAADCEYHSSIAGRMFSQAATRAGETGPPKQRWPEGLLSLAIDPLFAPAILTVGSLEYQLGRRDDAMDLFLTLTTLPAEEPDLSAIIDKAGNFLLDRHDYSRARDLYAEAEIGSNCSVDRDVVRNLVDGAWKVSVERRRDWTAITRINVWKDRDPVEPPGRA